MGTPQYKEIPHYAWLGLRGYGQLGNWEKLILIDRQGHFLMSARIAQSGTYDIRFINAGAYFVDLEIGDVAILRNSD